MGCSASSETESPTRHQASQSSQMKYEVASQQPGQIEGSPSGYNLKDQDYQFPKPIWEDFKGAPKKGSKFFAESYWNVNYTYQARISGDRVILTAQAKCVFNKEKSWVKPEKKSEVLLEHEQGHYYIGCLCAMNFNKRVQETTFSKENYKKEIQDLFNQTLQEYLQLEKLYDEETCHCLDRDQQILWDKKFDTGIVALRDFWWPEVVEQV